MESGGLFLQKRMSARGPGGASLAQDTHAYMET